MILDRLLYDTLDFIYPPRCAACGDGDIVSRDIFCGKCSEKLRDLFLTSACEKCALPLGDGASCPQCGGQSLYPFHRIVALGPFRDPLRSLIHSMKYHHRWPVAEILADRLLEQQRVVEVLEQTDCLIAVPLHWTRQIGRGYNQAASVARQLSKGSTKRIPVIHPVVRLKNTDTQATTHSRAERADNLRYAFGVTRPKSIAGKRITLVDDVMTTAATLRSLARTISQAKPASISAIVLAVADPRRQDFQVV